ncbi:hypothetical protein GYMLUDRAFT_156371 [Collybiopsis luxurians FD-317 M1]|nr:hypothetical protein GYMLUDRAFT_156371 [Collybiopsis luxurians FD-317 M1]
MRKISYVITFLAVVVSLIFTVLSLMRTDWCAKYFDSKVLHTQVTRSYGLNTLCELTRVSVPGTGNNSKLEYTSYECRAFPRRVKDGCEEEHSGFCAAWTSAGYSVEISIGCAALALLAILIGLSTGSRRRRIWKVVAGLVALHAALEIVAFAIVTDTMRQGAFPGFEYSKEGVAYGFNAFSWIFSVIITVAVVVTGISADQGHRWAAGNRAYRRIDP